MGEEGRVDEEYEDEDEDGDGKFWLSATAAVSWLPTAAVSSTLRKVLKFYCSPGRITPHRLSVVEAAAAAAPPETAKGRLAARARVGGESGEIPVGLEVVERIVPVGLVGMMAVKLPVGAVPAPAMAAAGAALALTEVLSLGLRV
jgi:hypothetical protein